MIAQQTHLSRPRFIPGLLVLLLLGILSFVAWLTVLPSSASSPAAPLNISAAPGTEQTSGCGDNYWRIIPSPNYGTSFNSLSGISVLAANDIWSVGSYFTGFGYQPLVLHWDGSIWNLVAVPDLEGNNNYLYSVAAISPNDVWAVGKSDAQTLIIHWNGTAWSPISSPNPGTSFNELRSVSAISSSDVWAVGSFQNTSNNHQQTLTLHWNGTSWTWITSPNPNNGQDHSGLNGVEAISSTDVWAVGAYTFGSVHTFALHWDGTAWETYFTPNVTKGTSVTRNYLDAVSAVSANDLWAVGHYQYYDPSVGLVIETLTLHWSGTAWTIVPSANLSSAHDSYLQGVVAIAADDVWAVGYGANSQGDASPPLTQHWDGTKWSIVSNEATTNQFRAVAASSSNDVWAVGYTAGSRTLTERYAPPSCQTPTATATATPTGICPQGWVVWPAPIRYSDNDHLYALTSTSANDVWAVGDYFDPFIGSVQPLLEHWNGVSWEQVPGPLVASTGSLRAVKALSSNDLWAAGSRVESGTGRNLILIEHWDGANWSIGPTPEDSDAGIVNAMAVISSDDVWLAGYNCCSSFNVSSTFVMHWDGSSWSVVPSPSVENTRNVLTDISPVSATDIWAVGFTGELTSWSNTPLLLHWDGATWSLFPSPNEGRLFAVEALSTDNVWVAGGAKDSADHILHNFTMRWNGNSWNPVSVPSTGTGHNLISDLSSLSTDNIWAAGYYSPDQFSSGRPQALQWNGVSWVTVANPVAGNARTIVAVEPASPGEVWVVGSESAGQNGTHLLIERYASLVPFSDVQPQDYFYEPVRYLYCAGIVSGYNDNTYRPGNNTTRSQLTKIMALAETWQIITPAKPTFADVLPDSPFYGFVETAVAQGIITGYPCGNPEPCDPQDTPYFRPGNDITRGQLSKITALAEGWTLLEPSEARFADVPVGSTFYRYVETAASRQIIGGYLCGGETEPCDPQDRPYFRPGNPATRGQIAKIVYNAINSP
jgi:hypothetical protein